MREHLGMVCYLCEEGTPARQSEPYNPKPQTPPSAHMTCPYTQQICRRYRCSKECLL